MTSQKEKRSQICNTNMIIYDYTANGCFHKQRCAKTADLDHF